MKIALVIVLLASTAHAEQTKLGDFSLGQELKKVQFVKTASAFGCTGSLGQKLDKGKVVGIELTADRGCKVAAVEAQLEKEYEAKPIVSVDKTAKLWEGKTGSVMVVKSISGSVAISVLKPGAGAKRPCFADDGFAAFWKAFKDSIDKPEALAAQFAFPLKDLDGKTVIKDAKTFAKQWPTILDAADKKAIAGGTLSTTCSLGVGSYDLQLSESSRSLEARRIGETWKWVEINDVSGG